MVTQMLALLRGHERGGIDLPLLAGWVGIFAMVAAAIAIPLTDQPGFYENDIATRDATGVSASSATLNGEVTYHESPSSETEVYFAWGTSPGSYTNETPRQAYARTFSAEITGLSAGTTYYFVAKAIVEDRHAYEGPEKSFRTHDLAEAAVETLDASGVFGSSAILNGSLTNMAGHSEVQVYFLWGTSPGSYTNETGRQTMTTSGTFTAEISGLFPGAAYYFVARAGDTGQGTEKSFYLAGAVDGSVETVDAVYPSTTMALLRGNLPDLGGASSVEVYFMWGESPGVYTHESPHQTVTAPGEFTQMITGPFNIGSTYYFVARAGAGQGEEKSFTVQ